MRLTRAQIVARYGRPFAGLKNRSLQIAALYAPGGKGLRVGLHRARGVTIGQRVFIGTSALLETSHPELLKIGDDVTIGVRVVIIAHWRETTLERLQTGTSHTVIIENNVYIGPGVIILPNVTLGEGCVVQAGSVVTTSVQKHMMVQGNPARPIARCSVPLTLSTPLRRFYGGLRPIHRNDHKDKSGPT